MVWIVLYSQYSWSIQTVAFSWLDHWRPSNHYMLIQKVLRKQLFFFFFKVKPYCGFWFLTPPSWNHTLYWIHTGAYSIYSFNLNFYFSNCVLLLLLLSRFSHVRLCAAPQMAVHQAPPSLGSSRQEHWSELPFPSPMHESEKWKWSCSVMPNS